MGGRGGGRGNRSRTQRRHFKQNRENVWKRPRADPASDNATGDPNWQPFATENPSFNEYYKEQGIVTAEEWDHFMEILRKPLPAAFRINSSSQFCADLRSQLENDFMQTLQAEDNEGGEVDAIRPLPWYPDNLAWHSNFSRMQLRKNQTLERFHEFLKLENEIGNITRQEAVSMVPPLFLDVQPDHFILDMCAAPGSKTFQLLEIIHQSTKPGKLPNGMVIANDLDVQRCNLLIHQTKRMCTANLIVTNHEAQHFPGCRSNRNFSNASEKGVEVSRSQLLFDRVLCDVPCSGDGTLRKAPDIWRKWNIGLGNGLHSLQIQIAMRGIALLKVGGRMVYSTCSMNPVEDEAVVAEILRQCGGSVELIDVSSELPQLVRRPGLKRWKVRDKGAWLGTYRDVPKYRRTGIVPSMFPSGRYYPHPTENGHNHENGADVDREDRLQSSEDVSTMVDASEEVCDLPLERCMRLMPHDQNTGAFFIAVLQKVSPLPVPVVHVKPTSPQRNAVNGNDELPKQSSDSVTEDTDGLKANLTDDTNEKLPGASPGEVSLVENEDSAALEHKSCDTHDKHNQDEAQASVDKETDSVKTGGKRKLQMQGKWRGVDPVLFLRDETVINSIKTFYGIDESFPLHGHLVTRNNDPSHMKRIYYISKSVKDILELNFRVGQQLKITSIGIKMFERQSSREGSSAPCAFRISSEGLPVILPYITKQILQASPADFKHLLQYKSIKFADFVDAEFGEKATNLMMGCCVIVLRKGDKVPTDATMSDASTIAIGCWKGRASLSVMVTALDCQELLERLGMRTETEKDDSTMEHNMETDEAQDILDDEKKEKEESSETVFDQ